jgi:single-strand DNA-binding protein
VTIWGKTAENLKPYLTKGRRVIISGYLKQDRWEKDGQKYSRIGIVADTVQLCGGREDAGSVNPNKAYNTASAARQADQQYAQQSGQNGQFSQNYAPQNATQYAPQNGQQGFTGDGFPENITF